jgi:hypothetical protein
MVGTGLRIDHRKSRGGRTWLGGFGSRGRGIRFVAKLMKWQQAPVAHSHISSKPSAINAHGVSLKRAVELPSNPEAGEEGDEDGRGDPVGPEFNRVDERLGFGEGVDFLDEGVEFFRGHEAAA